MSEQHEIDETPDDEQADEFASWDAFWDEATRKEAEALGQARTVVIRGVRVRVPQDIPMSFEFKAKKVKNSDSDKDFAALLASLFGTDVLTKWVAAGMGGREFRTVLHWGLSHGKGQPLTFQEAYDFVMTREQDEEAEGEDEGKA
ncbi:hypothetical protein AB0I81_40225 [Nonomuraea sp. NPDC050404]|uniref:hypothetical protein n=1 Tax=Nonomuraea sp. NPDC050404 TaxID=3155783 RepID=UPI0033E0C354